MRTWLVPFLAVGAACTVELPERAGPAPAAGSPVTVDQASGTLDVDRTKVPVLDDGAACEAGQVLTRTEAGWECQTSTSDVGVHHHDGLYYTKAELYTRATDLIGELESAIGKGGRRPRLAQTILPLLLALTIGAGTLLATRGVSAQDLGGENAVATAEAAAGGEASQRVRATIDPAAGMEEAATRYENGDFAGAAAVWRELAGAGVEDSRLWYNLGNAHFQGGEMGRAILAYRRAQRLAPRDREIRDNLALARSRRGDGTLSPEPSFWGRAWGWLRATFSPGELAVFGLALLWLATLLTLLLILKRAGWRRLRWMLVPVLVFLPLISAAAWVAEWQDWSGSEAVLLAPSVAVQSGPGADYITLFEIHEGAELRVRERRGGWLRVDLGEQLEGWIPAVAAETL